LQQKTVEEGGIQGHFLMQKVAPGCHTMLQNFRSVLKKNGEMNTPLLTIKMGLIAFVMQR
jgi:hypothetical protein